LAEETRSRQRRDFIVKFLHVYVQFMPTLKYKAAIYTDFLDS